MVWYCLQHNHSFRRSDDHYYAHNRKLNAEREEHVMRIMEIFGSARAVCLYAWEKFNQQVTVHNFNILRRKLRLINCQDDVVRVNGLLCGQGAETGRCS